MVNLLNLRSGPAIDKLEIVSPCSMSWDSMEGDERIRHCNSCDKAVFNLAQMTRAEIAAVLVAQMNTGSSPCIRMFKRPDGTVVTADCLSVRQKLRLSIQKSSAKFVAASAAIFAMTSLTALLSPGHAQDAFQSSDMEVASQAPGSKTKKDSTTARGETATTIQGVGGSGSVIVDNYSYVEAVLAPFLWVPLLSIAAAVLGIFATCTGGLLDRLQSSADRQS